MTAQVKHCIASASHVIVGGLGAGFLRNQSDVPATIVSVPAYQYSYTL